MQKSANDDAAKRKGKEKMTTKKKTTAKRPTVASLAKEINFLRDENEKLRMNIEDLNKKTATDCHPMATFNEMCDGIRDDRCMSPRLVREAFKIFIRELAEDNARNMVNLSPYNARLRWLNPQNLPLKQNKVLFLAISRDNIDFPAPKKTSWWKFGWGRKS